MGTVFIIVSIIDYISVTKHKKAQQNWEAVIRQRVEAERTKNQNKTNEEVK